MSLDPIRRIVTGHDSDGRAVVAFEGPAANVIEIKSVPGSFLHEIWRTASSPAPIDNGGDPTLGERGLKPPRGGTLIRIVDLPPDPDDLLENGVERYREAFRQTGDPGAHTAARDGGPSPHPFMHRTETVDYGIVLEGEITLILDNEERLVTPGCVVVQRGTNHAWANRSGRTARMLFVLIDGAFEPGLARIFKPDGR